MALKRQQNWLSQQNVAVPHLRSVESAVANDFDSLVRGWVTQEGYPYFIRGFRLKFSGAIGGDDTALEVIVDDAAVFHSTATEAGTVLTVPSGTANEILNAANTKIVGSFTAATTNFIALDYARASDSSTNDLVRFWDPDTSEEFSKTVPLARTMNYTFVIDNASFGTLLPIASVVVNANHKVVSITDCRPMLMRLGTGGSSPVVAHVYPWPDGPTVGGSGRAETPSIGATATTPFEGGDKEIKSLKDWMDATMSRILEMDGGTYWYSSSVGSIGGLVQNQNVHMLDSGVIWTWNLATETLTWSNTLTFQIPGSTAIPAVVTDNTLVAGFKVIGTGQCAYVTIDRTLIAPGPVTGSAVADSEDVPLSENTFVFARRDGDDVIVGTHSFRVKPMDATESDYSDHLAKDRLLKPVITQAGANKSIHIWPSQRVSGIKRRYIYIDPKVSSLFPRATYLTGIYSGGANNDVLTPVIFDNAVAGTLTVDTTIPTAPSPIASLAGVVDGFYPVLIAISTADAFTVTFGANYASLALATEDAALPVPTAADYPVAVVVIEVSGGVIQPITETHLLDRRPTGAGGSGGGGGAGTVVEYTAIGGETLIDFSGLPTPFTYTPATGDLAVIENGIELFVDLSPAMIDWRDYEETSASSITLRSPAVLGDRYKFRTGAGVTPLSIGDVVGPALATDKAIVRFNGPSGKIIQNSTAVLDNAGNLTGIVDLTMTGTLTGGASTFQIESVETDGAAAVGFTLDTNNALVTDGSKILSIQNNSIEYLNVRRGTNLYSTANVAITSVNDIAGTLALELSVDPTAVKALMTGLTTNFNLELIDDLTWGAGYKYCAFEYSQIAAPVIGLTAEMNGRGTVVDRLSGGQPGGAPGTAPTWWVTVSDDLGAETVTDAAVALYAEDYTECNRSDVRFSAIASGAATQGYIGIANTGAFFGGKTLIAPAEWLFESAAVDGATAVAYRLDTENALANAAALLLSLENNSVAKFVVDKDGNITTVGTVAGYLAKSLLTAKGDIITATAASTPTVVGIAGIADGWVLTKSAAAPGGLAWSAAGSGTVSGPGASTDQALVRWNGGTGTALLDSGTTLDGNGVLTHGGAVNYLRTTNADSAIALANALKATMNAHAADGAEHFAGGGPTPDIANFPVVTANATDLASLYTLCFDLFTAYDAHNLDAINVGPTYHNAQSLPGHALVSALIPTDLDEAITRLNDLKAKYNLHDADATNHTTGSLHQEVTVDSSGDCTSSSETIIGIVDTTSARAVTLSDSDKIAGRLMYIKDESGGATAMNITVTPQTGNIDGAGSVPISVDFGALRVYSDGTNWFSV